MTEYAYARGMMTYTRRVKLGKNEFHEFTANVPYMFNPLDDYLVCKEIIDRAADDVVAITLRKLGLVTEVSGTLEGYTGYTQPPTEHLGVVVKDLLEATVEAGRAKRAARKRPADFAVEKAVAIAEDQAKQLDARKRTPPAPVTMVFVEHTDEPTEEPLAGEIGSPEMTKALAQDQAKLHALREPVADPLLSGSDDAAGAGSEPSSDPLLAETVAVPSATEPAGDASDTTPGFDLDAELAAVPEEIDNDSLREQVYDWVKKNGGQKAVIQLKKLLMGFAPQVPAIPQERRADFLAQLQAIAVV